MAGEPQVDVDHFWTEGYTIVRGAYSPDEIRTLRAAALASKDTERGDLLVRPALRGVLLDGRLVGMARQILGSDEIWYSGDSSMTINSNQHRFHKDNADRSDGQAPDWQNGRYTLLRFGIYLQDHYRHTAGLNLRSRSHNATSLTAGRNVYVRTRVGDVAIWNMRITHAGNATLLKFPKWYSPEPGRGKRLPRWLKAKPDGDRIALFAALGLDDAHHDRYVEYLKTRTYMVGIWRSSVYDEETLAAANAIGLHVRDVRHEIQGDDSVGQNVDYRPIPYATASTTDA
jgi:hypothetical protein